jgi:hypothetical protein
MISLAFMAHLLLVAVAVLLASDVVSESRALWADLR